MTGSELKRLREGAGLKLPQLVKMLKPYSVNNWKVFRWENDEHKIPKRIQRLLPSLLAWHAWLKAAVDTLSKKSSQRVAAPSPSHNERGPTSRPTRDCHSNNFFPGRWPTVNPTKGAKQMTDSNITIKTLLVDSILHQPEIQESKFTRYTQALIQSSSDKRARELTSADLENYLKERAVPAFVVHRELSFLARVYDLAFQKGLVNKRVVITGESDVKFFPAHDYQKQVAALKDFAKDITRFVYLTGWEHGDVIELRWDKNYDSQQPAVLYEQRRFPLHGELLALMRERLSNRVDDCPYIFHRDGKKLSIKEFATEWRRARRSTRVSWHFADLRRAAAVNLRLAGFEPEQIVVLTGYTKKIPVSYRYEVIIVAEPVAKKKPGLHVHRERNKPRRAERFDERSEEIVSRSDKAPVPVLTTTTRDTSDMSEMFALMAELGVG
jgi:integrase